MIRPILAPRARKKDDQCLKGTPRGSLFFYTPTGYSNAKHRSFLK